MDEASPYAPPGADLAGADLPSDCETFTYPLVLDGTNGFAPRSELRDAVGRLLWLAKPGFMSYGLPIQVRREGSLLQLRASLASIRTQRWLLKTPDKVEVGSLQRVGGCLPALLSPYSEWVGQDSKTGRTLVVKSTGSALRRWWASRAERSGWPPLAPVGQQRPERAVWEDATKRRRTFFTVHESQGSPAFLRVRATSGWRVRVLIERLEGEVPAEIERLGHQASFLLLSLGLR